MSAATSTATVVINAKNATGPAFKGVLSSLGGIGKWFNNSKVDIALTAASMLLFTDNSKKAVDEAAAVENAALSAANRAALGFTVLTGSINLATQGLVALKNAFGDALERQTSNLNAVITATKTLGVTRQQAGEFVEGFNKQVAILGRDLPTSAENISVVSRTIIDDYSLALKSAGASTGQVKDALIGSSSKIALLSELSGGNTNDTRAAISGYLSGSVGVEGLDVYSFFGNNTTLRTGLAEGARKQGKDLTSFTGFERVKLLIETLDKSITPEDIQQLQGLSKAKISSFTDRLFDPEIGIFSIQRDLDSKLPGYQSVFTSLERTLDLVIGDRGIIANIGKALGISDDAPMQALKFAVDQFNEFLEGIRNLAEKLPKFNIKIDLKNFSQNIDAAAIGKFIATGINTVANLILKIITSIDYGALIGAAFTIFSSILVNLDWKVYAIAGAWIVFSTLAPILSFIVVLMFQVILGQILAAMFGPIMGIIISLALPLLMPIILALGGALILVIVGVILAAIAIFNYVRQNWDSLSKPILSFFSSIGRSIKVFATGIDAFLGAIAIFNYVRKNWSSISKSVVDFFNWIGRSIKIFTTTIGVEIIKAFEKQVKFYSDLGKGIIREAGKVLSFFGTLFSDIMDYLKYLWNAVTGQIKKTIDSTSETFSNAVSSPTTSVTSSIATGVTAGVSIPTIKAVTSAISSLISPKFDGHIPSAANGLFSAITLEMQNKPPGSGLAIANTSEAILTPEMLSNLVSGTYNAGAVANQKGNANVVNIAPGAITVNLPKGSDRDIAYSVIQILEDAIASELNTIL